MRHEDYDPQMERDRFSSRRDQRGRKDFRNETGFGADEWTSERDWDEERGGLRGSRYGGTRPGGSSPFYGEERSYGGSSGTGSWNQMGGSMGQRESYRDEYGGRYGRGSQDFGRGQHTGRGPKGYTRSDEKIKDELCEMLTAHGDIDATDIEIDVRNGEVTLTGTVEGRFMKRQAEELAEDVSGVKEVINQIRMKSQQGKSKQGHSSKAA